MTVELKLNTREAAAFIRRSAGTVRQYVAAGEIPYCRLPSGQLLFDRSELDQWLKLERQPKRRERKANTMSLYRRKKEGSEIWWMSYFTADGKIQESCGTTSRTEAEQIYKRRLDELERGVWRHPKNRKMSFGELVDQYLESNSFVKLSRATQRFNRQRLAHVRARFAHSQVLSLSADDVENFVNDRLEDDDTSSTTVFHDVTMMFRILHWAFERRLIPHLPFPTRGLKPRRADFLGRVLGVEEEKLALAAAQPHQRAILLLALDAGLRSKEVFGQRWEHVDFGRNLLAVSKTKGGTWGIGRQIPMTSRLHAALLGLPHDAEQVATYRGKAYAGDARECWYRIREQAGADGLRFHDLRATFDTRLEELGVPPMISMALMGHKRKSVHDRYSRPQLPALREAIGRLDGWLRENGLSDVEMGLRAVE